MIATVSNIISTISLTSKTNELVYQIDEKAISLIVSQIERLMNHISTYQKITLFVAIVGVVVNYFVVKTALLPYKNRVELEISSHIQMVLGGIQDQQILLFSLIVKNKGYRNIKLTQWGYTSDKKTKMQIIEMNKKRFPLEIFANDSYTFQIPMRDLLNGVNRNIAEKNINNRMLYFYVIDAVGKTYYVKMRENVNSFIKRAGECCKDDKWSYDFYQ